MSSTRWSAVSPSCHVLIATFAIYYSPLSVPLTGKLGDSGLVVTSMVLLPICRHGSFSHKTKRSISQRGF
ncbi:hypothetical protein KZ420_07645 [Glaesserella parasuis]|nr:hypothetical protein [Glaesserella parasuis]MCT8767531.1 hypothetical protein [Glaesserella parasuis]